MIACLFYTCNTPGVYVIDSGVEGPHTLIIGSMHGNEPAGYMALMYLVGAPTSDFHHYIQKGKLTIIPTANPCGVVMDQRHHPVGDFDINRNFPYNTYINTQLATYVKQADWVVDLHEGWGFHKLQPDSIGSGIYAGQTKDAQVLTEKLAYALNSTIYEPTKQFSTHEVSRIPGSLRDYCDAMGMHYILVETSGINNIQPLHVRMDQQIRIIINILQALHSR